MTKFAAYHAEAKSAGRCSGKVPAGNMAMLVIWPTAPISGSEKN